MTARSLGTRALTRGLLLAAPLVLLPAATHAQRKPLNGQDSALVGRILLAEDRRDSTDSALVVGVRHADARLATLARRALGRIRDSVFAARDSLPPLPPPPVYTEPAWRLRYRALATRKEDCAALGAALADSAWPVRLRAADLLPATCTSNDAIASTLRTWVDSLPANTARRAAGGVSWHAGAHAAVALAKLRPDEARARLTKLALHRQWQVRVYAARAAGMLSDTVRLRIMARDPDDNVREAAIEALSKLVGHEADDVYISAMGAIGAQAVRAAAVALKGSPRADVRRVTNGTYIRWSARGIASARDARIALLEAAGRSPADDKFPRPAGELLPDAVALALGADIRLRVTMAPASGGGSFVVRLRGDVAPLMASRILALVRGGYYDGLTWHRVLPDFVIQGGSPGASEYVGLSEYIRDELGTVPHVRGTVGMSTRGHDTGDAQWFINLRNNASLARDYTVFAEIVEGIDVVDGILEGDVMTSITELPAR